MPSNGWPFLRSRVAARDVLQEQMERLAALGVVLSAVPARAARALFATFVEQFIDPARAVELLARRADAAESHRGIELARWLRPDRTRHGGPLGCVRWLASGRALARAVRFDRRPALPALEIALDTIDDTWAASWPGVYVNFDAGRVVVITLDYEDVRCDVRAAPPTPYR